MTTTTLHPDTMRLLVLLASEPDGITAAALRDKHGLTGTPVPRLNALKRRFLAKVDSHDQRWWITHEGWDVMATEVGEAREQELMAPWRDRECDCHLCVAFRSQG